MTVPAAFTALAVRFEAMAPTGGAQLTDCLTSLRLEIQESDFPLGMLRLARDTEFALKTEAFGLGRLDYVVEALIFLGGLERPLPQLDELAKPWPLAILTALAADLTLAGGIAFLGGGDGSTIATCQIGVIPWNNVPYWGLTVKVPLTEKPNITMG